MALLPKADLPLFITLCLHLGAIIGGLNAFPLPPKHAWGTTAHRRQLGWVREAGSEERSPLNPSPCSLNRLHWEGTLMSRGSGWDAAPHFYLLLHYSFLAIDGSKPLALLLGASETGAEMWAEVRRGKPLRPVPRRFRTSCPG